MPCYSLSQIQTTLGGSLIGEKNRNISHILTDSRGLSYPEESLFFAIRGLRHDGHHFIEELIQRGVLSFVVDHLPEIKYQQLGISFLVVDNVLHALQKLASMHRQTFTSPVIGITGSNGKTVVKEWIYQSIHWDFSVVRSPKSYNSQIENVPFPYGILNPCITLQLSKLVLPCQGK